MRLDSDILAVLAAAETDGNALKLTGQLDRALYVKVGRAIETAGGKWNRKAGAHIFSTDAAGIVAGMLSAGTVVSERTVQQFFPTPPEVVARLITAAALSPSHLVLEPSAGRGAIATPVSERVRAVDCVELHGPHADVIRSAGYARMVTTADFLTIAPEPAYDRVIMNPPFAGKADVAHVQHALRFLKPAGVLVSVMSAGLTFRTDWATVGLREVVNGTGGTIETLPPQAFAESGTDAGTVIVVIPVPAAVAARAEQLDLFGDARQAA
jgi:protein-L-isoaspartate O-methyltransferase